MSHVYIEINQFHIIINIDIHLNIYQLWEHIPQSILNAFTRNRIEQPEYMIYYFFIEH